MMEKHPSHADIMDQLSKGSERFSRLETLLATVIEKVELIPQMQADIAAAKADITETRELVEAWTAIKTAGKFVKWAGGVIGALLLMLGALRAVTRGFF